MRRKCINCENDVLHQVLEDAEASLIWSDFQRLHKVIFVWSQRATYLLNGTETWEDQHIGPVRLGGYSEIDE
jgi:hypothetical protein